jgi:hypothetical protein
MDTIKSGIIIWGQNGKSGFKRIIIEKNPVGITLFGEDNFKTEKFAEKE